MSVLSRKPFVLMAFVALLGGGAIFLATAPLAANLEKATLPSQTDVYCPTHCNDGMCEGEIKEATIAGIGTFQTVSTGGSPVVAHAGEAFISASGLKTVPIRLASIDGKAFAEGVGETHFWLDASRPVKSAIWEKKAKTEFPAIQEMRFNFFYTVEAMPGKVYRSVQPAIMRTDNLTSFPPPAGTRYHLVKPVDLEEIREPGVIVGRILSNQLTMGGEGRLLPTRRVN